MRPRRLAHVSDLHFGAGRHVAAAAARLRQSLERAAIDHVVATGDITNRGRTDELDAFHRVFGDWIDDGIMSVIPGNHDRLGDDVGAALMQGPRVQVHVAEHLWLVRVDSTATHNRWLWAGHGVLSEYDLEDIEQALEHAPRDHLRVVSMHHHPLPLPEEDLIERFSSWMRWPYAAELSSGRRLLERICGRCDLLLHGHRHVPSETLIGADEGLLRICNAGSSTELGGMRIFEHAAGRIIGTPQWFDARDTNVRTMAERRAETLSVDLAS